MTTQIDTQCKCGWHGDISELGAIDYENDTRDDARVELGSCPRCYRVVYGPDEDAGEQKRNARAAWAAQMAAAAGERRRARKAHKQ